MNKTAIRNFAVWARNKLIADVSYHAGLLGITKNDISKALPQSTKDVEFYDIGTAEPYAIRGEEIQQRKSLVDAIHAKEKDSNYETAYNSLMEEVAYTWFNRLIAVRFMEVNDYLPEHVRVLSSESGKQEPDIVTTPFDAELFFAEGEQQKIIQMKNDNKLDEVFRILFIKQCRELSRILPRLFEGTNDYTELLLSLSFIDQEGVVYHLVHDIPEDDFNVEKGGQVEIIGWLYQYYNEEKKRDAINLNKGKVSKEDIPAATQLFTTDWVVRYIVDNSLGKYWINHSKNSSLRYTLEFFVDESNGEDIQTVQPEEIKVMDPCVGSGHFLVYAFDVLMQIYEECGYSQRDAAKLIVERNLYGIDIDNRAGQMAYFSILMKARQYARRIFDEDIECNVMAIEESNFVDRDCLELLDDENRKVAEGLLDDFENAKCYGSLIVPSADRNKIEGLLKNIHCILADDCQDIFVMAKRKALENVVYPIVKQSILLSDTYQCVVTNPPYLNKYNDELKRFINGDKYEKYSGDLFSAFIYRNLLLCDENGYAGYMTPYVWMFIKTYEPLRELIINEKSIASLIQFEYSAFEEATVPICAFIIQNGKNSAKGSYFRLADFKGGMEIQKEKVKEGICNKNCGYYFRTNQENYKKIPGCPIAYWIPATVCELFDGKKIDDIAFAKAGIVTGDDQAFIRLWEEVDFCNIRFKEERYSYDPNIKWVPMNKGGGYRKYYGNNDYVMDIYNLWTEGKTNKSVRRGDTDSYYQEGITWSMVTSGKSSFRYSINKVFGVAAPAIFMSGMDYSILGYLNSKVVDYLNEFLNPTINILTGNILSLPYKEGNDSVDRIVKDNLSISKEDWDSFETSWDFKKHPLI